tara:strand:+ start:15039 stop:15731 length:693 start_codon:yes stop_codon:yes gene_type:complete
MSNKSKIRVNQELIDNIFSLEDGFGFISYAYNDCKTIQWFLKDEFNIFLSVNECRNFWEWRSELLGANFLVLDSRNIVIDYFKQWLKHVGAKDIQESLEEHTYENNNVCDNDMLKNMFTKQEVLMKRYKENDENFPEWPIDLTDKQQQKFVRDILCNLADEAFEASRVLNWKSHRATNIKFDRNAFLTECVDVSKYLLEALTMCGIDANEFFEAYCKKDEKCHARLSNKE